MIRGILFDMDGVICDTNPYHSKAFKEFFAKRKIYPTEEEFSKHMYGKSNSYILSHFLGRKIEGEELLQLEHEKESLFREIYADYVQPIGRFMDFFNSIKKVGMQVAVATSAPRANMDLILACLEIDNAFDSKLGSEDVINHKPNPEVYMKSMQNLGLTADDCIVFEDSFSGVTAGIAAGCNVVGVLSSHTINQLPPCNFYTEDYENISLEKLSII